MIFEIIEALLEGLLASRKMLVIVGRGINNKQQFDERGRALVRAWDDCEIYAPQMLVAGRNSNTLVFWTSAYCPSSWRTS